MMKRCRKKRRAAGVMTVFFALLTVPFLSVIFALLESVRYQGAAAQAAQITELGNYSVFGEYERKLLRNFDLFGVDGSYGSGDFAIGRVNDRLKHFLSDNASPNSEGIAQLAFDPWQLTLSGCEISDYALLSDGRGDAFYQQAVSYMRKTAITNVIGKLLSFYRDARAQDERQKSFREKEAASRREQADAQKQIAEKKQELLQTEAGASSSDGGGDALLPQQAQPVEVEDPLEGLRSLMAKDILTVVCPARKISEKTLEKDELPSRRKLQTGSMEYAKPWSGLVNDLIFREYLLDHFDCYTDPDRHRALTYELEYLLGGRMNDRDNLKTAVRRLLLLREGSNYWFISGDPVMSAQAGALAVLLTGWTGIDAIVTVTKQALLLGWAYAESLLDVRCLMAGKKVALFKDSSTWQLQLENLADVEAIIKNGGKDQPSGLVYKDYLRLLLDLQKISVHKIRGLDLVELRIRKEPGLSNFRSDHCLIAMRDEAVWQTPPLFSMISARFTGGIADTQTYTVKGGFAYDHR